MAGGKRKSKDGIQGPIPSFDWEDLLREVSGRSMRGRSHPGFTLEEYKERGGFLTYTDALRDLRRKSEQGLINAIEGTVDGKSHELFVRPPLGVPSTVGGRSKNGTG